MSQVDCPVCRKHRGQEPVPGGPIYQDEWVVASHAAVPAEGRAYLGWCFVEPRRHIGALGELSATEAAAIGRLMARLSRALQAELEAERVYAFVYGSRVRHLHVQLIARYPGTPRQYWGANVDEWPDAPRGDEGQVAALVARLRARLAANLEQPFPPAKGSANVQATG